MAIQNTFPAVKPSLNLDFANTKQLDPRITFTRASTATYYDGKTTAKAEENLFLQSQFASTWVAGASTKTVGAAVAPDGTTTAVSLVPNTTPAVAHSLVQSAGAIGLVYTISVYAKANGYTNIQFFGDSSGNFTATFDLTAVSAAFSGAATAASIVSVGSGWYRCVATFTQASSTRLNIQGFPTGATASNFGNTFTGDDTSGIYLWGAQLEQRASVTAYTPTTTQPITNYIPALQTAPAGVPRFDHNPVTGESLGFLIEEQRANLLTYSADLTNAAWLKTGATATGDTVIAPDGTLTADSLVEDTTTGEHRALVIDVAKSASAVMTLSVYVKPAGRYVVLTLEYSGVGLYTTFDVLTNQYWDFSADTGWTRGQTVITSVGNGWYRCSISGTTSANLTVTPRIHLASVAGFNKNTSYTGDGTSGIYLWGAQLEAGAFPTSYIPTVASQVTRSADVASMTGTNFSSWYRADEGTIYAEASPRSTSAKVITNIYNSSSGDTFGTNLSFTNSGQLRASVSGGYDTGATGPSYSPGMFYKIAFAIKSNEYKAYFGGVADVLLSNNPNIVAAGAIAIGRVYWGGAVINGTIKRIAYYPKRLSNTELQSITS